VTMHQQAGYGSLYGWFSNPSAEVSAHFWAAQDGRIEQYVDSDCKSWAGVNQNALYLSIEFEGQPADPITADQAEAGAAILSEAKRRHGVPLIQANSCGESGFGYHRMPNSGVSTACPSDLRLSARPHILDLASGGASPSPIEPETEDDVMVIATNKAGGQWLIWGSFRTAIANPSESDKYQKAGAKKVDWTEEMIQKFPIAQNAVK
jgi:hypothetical protein